MLIKLSESEKVSEIRTNTLGTEWIFCQSEKILSNLGNEFQLESFKDVKTVELLSFPHENDWNVIFYHNFAIRKLVYTV